MRKARFLIAVAVMVPGGLLAQQPAEQPTEQQAAARPITDFTIPEILAEVQKLQVARRYNEAANALNYVLQKEPTNIDALRLAGDISWETQNAWQARQYWLRVRQIQPNDFGANFGLGLVHLSSGQYRQALNYLEPAARTAPADRLLDALIALARAYRGAFDLEKSLQTAMRAVQLDPESYDAWYLLVTLWVEQASTDEDFDKALAGAERLRQIATNALQTSPTPEANSRLNAAYDLYLQVLYAFRQVLFERNPDGTLSDRLLPGRERRAAAVIGRIVDIMLLQAELRQRLMLFQILDLATQAVRYDGGSNPESLLRVASLQARVGQLDAARQTLQRVLEIDPDNEPARRQLQMLESAATGSAATPAQPTPAGGGTGATTPTP